MSESSFEFEKNVRGTNTEGGTGPTAKQLRLALIGAPDDADVMVTTNGSRWMVHAEWETEQAALDLADAITVQVTPGKPPHPGHVPGCRCIGGGSVAAARSGVMNV